MAESIAEISVNDYVAWSPTYIEAEAVLLKRTGPDQEEDLFAPVLPRARRRGIWLGINLIAVFLAAWVIGQFDQALSGAVIPATVTDVIGFLSFLGLASAFLL